MNFRSESDLENAAVPFLKGQELRFTWQVPLHGRVVDLAAIDSQGYMLGIEFKLADWKRALVQASLSSNAFDFVFVCVPGGRYMDKLKAEASREGIGVLVYDDDAKTIRVELPAAQITRQWRPNLEYVREYVSERGSA